jgi:hypothetical protein
MGEETKNIQTSDAGNKNGQKLPTMRKTFRDYAEGLHKTDIPDGHTQMQNSIFNNESKRKTRANKRCFLEKADQTIHFYRRINNTISVFAKQDAEEIRDNVSAYMTQNQEIDKKLGEALKALKTAKEKIGIVKDKAYKLDEARKNSANSDPAKALDKAYGSKGDFGKVIEELKNNAENTFNIADDALEVAVKVSGIRAGANIDALKDPSVKLAEEVGKIQTDVSGNIANAQTHQTSLQAEYEQALRDLSKSKYDKYDKTLTYEAILDTTSQVHELDCKGWNHTQIKARLKELADKVESNFSDNS